MKYPILAASALAASLCLMVPIAKANNIANCEIVLMETIEDENGNGGAQVASYRPAADFIASVYNDEEDAISEIDGLAIRALLCSRKNVIISDTDFKLLATGVPFILSQNFDSNTSNLLTYFFKDGTFQYTHKGDDLPDNRLAELTKRIEDFNTREDVIEALTAARQATREAQASDASDGDAEKYSGEDNSDEETSNNETSIDIVEISPDAETSDIETLDVEPNIDGEATDKTDNTQNNDVEIVELKTDIEETIPEIITETPQADIDAGETPEANTDAEVPSGDDE